LRLAGLGLCPSALHLPQKTGVGGRLKRISHVKCAAHP
jgi:hypothetical protein